MTHPAFLLDDGRFAIECDSAYSADFHSFAKSLPSSRFHKPTRQWRCLGTPYTAVRLIDNPDVTPSADILAISLGARNIKEESCYSSFVAEGIPSVYTNLTPWDHQREAFWWASQRHGSLLELRMGEGKSYVAVTLSRFWDCKRILILCPHAVLGVWPREYKKHGPEFHKIAVCDGRSTKKKAKQADTVLSQSDQDTMAIAVVNYESAWREPFASWALAREWDLVILDESHRIKSPSAKCSRFAHKLARRATRRLGLTGTPMNTPLDIYSQAVFCDPGYFGTSYTRFRSRYAKMSEMFPSQVQQYQNLDELKETHAKFSFRVEGDVLNLPPAMHEHRTFDLCPAARRAYDEFEKELTAEVAEGTITADNALTKLLRLQQMTGGNLVLDEGDDGTRKQVVIDEGKKKLLADMLSDLPTDEPIVVCTKFRHDLAAVRDVAEQQGRRYGEVSGQQKDLTEHAQMPEDIDVLGVQIQSGGTGIDLTRARYVFLYSVGYSLLDYEQFLCRVHRPGQTRTTFFYHLLANSSVDQRVYKALDQKRDVVESVLEGLAAS